MNKTGIVRKKNGEPIWQTRDGKRIPLSKMSTEHIENARAMLEREFSWELLEIAHSADSLNGDMAQYYASGELAAAKPSPWVDLFERELRRRDRQRPCAAAKTSCSGRAS